MFLFRRKGGLTAKRLAIELNCGCSRFKVPRYRDFVVNYGGKYIGASLNANIEFNKLKVSQILQENGISTPKVFVRGEYIPDEMFPLLARKKYHSQGRDIIYIHNRLQLNRLEYNYDYLIQYINKTSEYRVHVLGDYDIMTSVKIANVPNADPIVRSKRNGWIQVSYDRDFQEALIELAKKTIKVLGYNFGAVDIIRKENKLYVLEVNSAPGLEPRKLKKYAEYFKHCERRNNESVFNSRRSRRCR